MTSRLLASSSSRIFDIHSMLMFFLRFEILTQKLDRRIGRLGRLIIVLVLSLINRRIQK